MDKIVFNDSFDFGLDRLVTIADDPAVMRKCASSSVVDKWGKIDPVPGHTLIHLIALGDTEHTGSNRNADGWRGEVLQRKHATFKEHGALYRNHQAEPDKKEGFVHKTAYHKEMGRVELLVAAAHDKCASWLKDVEKGKPVSFSMGFRCTDPGDQCSICGNFAKTRADYCEHVQKNASGSYGLGRILPDGRKCFVYNDAGYFNDISQVPVGADQIAMHLRKVASLGDENDVIGGAELAERYFIKRADIDHGKIALAHKAAAIEKRIEMIGQGIKTSRKRKLSKVAQVELRSVPYAEMFRELVKVGAVLPLVDFYELVFGSEFSKYAGAIEGAAAEEALAFSKVAGDPKRLAGICSNSTYDPATISHASLTAAARHDLAVTYSIDPDLAAQRALKRASIQDLFTQSSTPSAQSDYLLDNYLSYKLAALVAITPELRDDVIFAALI